MRIPCPHCGARFAEEFSYLGAADLPRPADDAPLSDWTEHVYQRENPMGRHRELWRHNAGCGAWLVVTRDTRTHEIFAAEPARR